MTIDERLSAAASAVNELWADPTETEGRYAGFRARLHRDAAQHASTPEEPEAASSAGTDCAEILDHLYEFLDGEMPEDDRGKFVEHFEECASCLVGLRYVCLSVLFGGTLGVWMHMK
jgi:hypothetical protein